MDIRATWFCVDIECSGPVPGLYDMLSLGVVAVVPDEQPGRWRVDEDGLYLEFIPTAPRVDEGALAVCGLDMDRLRAEGLPLAEGLDQLAAWVAERTREGSEPVFVGHNAPFDWMFVSHAHVSCDRRNPFGYKALDTKALSSGVLGLHWLDSNKETLENELGLPPQDSQLVHRADYDAAYQGLILARLLERQAALPSWTP